MVDGVVVGGMVVTVGSSGPIFVPSSTGSSVPPVVGDVVVGADSESDEVMHPVKSNEQIITTIQKDFDTCMKENTLRNNIKVFIRRALG